MQLSKAFQIISVAAVVSAETASVAYDPIYDDKSLSLASVACSDGQNGLLGRYPTIGDIPTAYVGAVPAVEGWNSVNCGTCWAISWQGKTVPVLAIDSSRGSGFNIAQAGLDDLTNGQAVALGRITADAVQVDKSVCGL